jgi:hypothetical protein
MSTLGWLNEAYPISGFNFTGFTVIEFNGNLQTPGGAGCGTGWNQLFGIIANMRSMSKSSDTYVAVLPPGVPTLGTIGCGGGGVAIGYRGDGPTFAQEVGHGFGRQHAPCPPPPNSPPNVDSSYPTYDSYPSGSIGEFGMDTSQFLPFNPANTFDFMSYCSPVWVSPYTYVALKNTIAAIPAAVAPGRAEVRDVLSDCLYLNFRLHQDDRIELLPSYLLEGPPAGLDVRDLSDLRLHLIGPGGEVIAIHQCHVRDPHQSRDKPYMDFHETVLWDPTAEAIAFYREGERLYVVDLGQEPPAVRVRQPQPVEAGGDLVRLDWTMDRKAPAGRSANLTYVVRYTCDDGQNWRVVAADLTEPHHVIDLALLPGGERCRFQVAASAGIRTTLAETETFAVPRKPVRVHILSPKDGSQLSEDEPLLLNGFGYSPDFGTTEPEDGVWTSSHDGNLGVGQQLLIPHLTPGRHRITLTVGDGLGAESAGIVSVIVNPAR